MSKAFMCCDESEFYVLIMNKSMVLVMRKIVIFH